MQYCILLIDVMIFVLLLIVDFCDVDLLQHETSSVVIVCEIIAGVESTLRLQRKNKADIKQ